MRIKLMAAVISSDKKFLKDFFKHPPYSDFLTNAGLKLSDVKYITKHEDPVAAVRNNAWVSPTALILMHCIMRDESGIPYSEKDQVALMTDAMSTVPDNKLSLAAKHNIGKAISDNFKNIRVAYNEFQKPLSGAKSSGIITPAVYKDLLSLDKDKLSQSDFILLTIGLLQGLKDIPELESALKSIRKLYTATEYQAVSMLIKRIAEYNSSEIGDDLSKLIQSGSDKYNMTDVDNYSRRFFESRYAALHHLSADEMESVNRILNHFDFDIAKDESSLINQVTALSEAKMPDCFARMIELKRKSIFTQDATREYKESFGSKQGEAVDGKRSDTIYSRNTGVMKSSQPNYYDELSSQLLRNSPVDILRPIKTYSQYDSFARGSYVAGVSSHAYFIIAVLEKYALNNKNSKTLEKDINTFIQALTTTYANRGYHGMQEIMLPFDEQFIRDHFAKNFGIKLSTEYNEKTIVAACNDAQTYTETMC